MKGNIPCTNLNICSFPIFKCMYMDSYVILFLCTYTQNLWKEFNTNVCTVSMDKLNISRYFFAFFMNDEHEKSVRLLVIKVDHNIIQLLSLNIVKLRKWKEN